MDEFLSEKEQLEQIRAWWRENGAYLIGGVALGALLLLGWNRYNAYQEGRAEAAAALYQALQQAFEDDARDEAEQIVEQLRSESASSPYTDQGGLLLAVMYLNAQQSRRATDQLRYVLDATDDDELAMIVRLRLARVLADQQRYEEALAAIEVEPGGFSARYSEVRGDIHLAMGDTDGARAAYAQALNAAATDLVDRSLVQMKLDDLPLPEAAGAAAEEAAVGEEAAIPDPAAVDAVGPEAGTSGAESAPAAEGGA